MMKLGQNWWYITKYMLKLPLRDLTMPLKEYVSQAQIHSKKG